MERVCKSWHYGLSGLKVQFTLSLLQSHREIFFVTRAISRFVVLGRKVLNSLNALELNSTRTQGYVIYFELTNKGNFGTITGTSC